MVPGAQEGGREEGIHCAILCVGNIQGGRQIEEVFHANNRIDLCTIPELTHEYLVKIN